MDDMETRTAAQERGVEEKRRQLEDMPPVARRMRAVREQLEQLEDVLGELQQQLTPVLLEDVPAVTQTGGIELDNRSPHGAQLENLARHLQLIVQRVQSLAGRIDL